MKTLLHWPLIQARFLFLALAVSACNTSTQPTDTSVAEIITPSATVIPAATEVSTPTNIPTATFTPMSTNTPTATSTPRPTLTPTATFTQTPSKQTPDTSTCTDNLAYVQDLTDDDKNMTASPKLEPGQSFEKGWRVRNNGTCVWDNSYALLYVDGNVPAAAHKNGKATAIEEQVMPGAEYDLWVNLVAPLEPGVYQGFWQMYNGDGVGFGERLRVDIELPDAATATPLPQQTLSPQIEFSADRSYVKVGMCINFTWNVENVEDVKEVYFYTEGESWAENGVTRKDTRQVCQKETTTYYLRVVKLDGTVEMGQIRIPVEAMPGL